MRNSATTYRLATSPRDYAKCHGLARAAQRTVSPFGFPTVMAERDGELVAFLGTHQREDMLLAGPLVLKPGLPSVILKLRLGEVYENLLCIAGVKFYVLGVEKTDAKSLEFSKRMGMEQIGETDTQVLFRRSPAPLQEARVA